MNVYSFINAKEEDLDLIVERVMDIIKSYDENGQSEEINNIKKYIAKDTHQFLKYYKLIMYDEKFAGIFLSRKYGNGFLIDDIYLDKPFRNKGIGSKILIDEIQKHKFSYLWVYKNNVKALKLYKTLGFKIIRESTQRYFMKYENNK